MELITTPNLESPDDFYAASHALTARLVLLLANHIGSLDVLQQAMHVARGGVQ
jgi:hypothetical protein